MLSGHKEAHQACRCAAPCTQRLWPRQAAHPAQISPLGSEAGGTCWMSSSSCSRCSRETLYCSSRTRAKYSVLRIDSFSFTVRMMSCGHRGTRVTKERAGPHVQAQSGEDSPDLPSAPPCCQGEKGPCWLGPLPIQEANLDGPHVGLFITPSGPCARCSLPLRAPVPPAWPPSLALLGRLKLSLGALRPSSTSPDPSYLWSPHCQLLTRHNPSTSPLCH